MNIIKSPFLQISVAYIMVGVGLMHAAEGQSLLQSHMPLGISLQEYSPISMRTRTQHYDFQSSSHVSPSSSSSTSSASVICAQEVSLSPKLIKVHQKTDVVYCKFCIDVRSSVNHEYALEASVVQELEVLFGIARSQCSGSGEKGQPFVYQFEQTHGLEYVAAIVAGELLEKGAEHTTVEELQNIINQSEGKGLPIMAQDVCSYILFCFFIEQALRPELKNCALLYQSVSSCLMRVYLGYFDVEVQAFVKQMTRLEEMIGADEKVFSCCLKNQDNSLARVEAQTFTTYSFGLLRQALRNPKQIKGILNQGKASLLLNQIASDDSVKSIQSTGSRQGGSPKSSGWNSANGSLRSIGIGSPCLSPRVLMSHAHEQDLGDLLQTDYRQLALPAPLLDSGASARLTNGTEEVAFSGQSCWLKRCFKKYPKVTACLATLITAGVGCGTYCIYAYTSWFHR